MQNPSKINQNGAKGCSESDLGASWFEVAKKGAKASYKIQIIGATCAILGAILGPAGRQGAPKIEHFVTKSLKSREI